jgi:hypothetical protein
VLISGAQIGPPCLLNGLLDTSAKYRYDESGCLAGRTDPRLARVADGGAQLRKEKIQC